MSSPSGKTLKLVVVTPERAVLDHAADFVVLPLFDGEIGVLPGRAPFVGQLGPGELRYKNGSITERLFVDGGFVQVQGDVINVLTPVARTSEALNESAIVAERVKANALPESNAPEKATKLRAAARVNGMAKVLAKKTA